jgi:integrase
VAVSIVVKEVDNRRRARINGEGTVRYNDERRRWEGRVISGWSIDGKQIRREVTGRTRAEVVKRLRALTDAVENGEAPARRDLSVGRFLDDWAATALHGSVAPATEALHLDVIRLYVKPHLGRKHLATLNARNVTKMLHALEAEGRAPNTRRLARSVLRRALRWAEAEGLVARNVAAVAQGVRLKTAEGRTLTPEQARALLRTIDGHRLEAAFTVALALGLRRGELLGLSWDDLTLDAAPPRLTVRRSLTRNRLVGLQLADTKTRGSRRTVHLPGPVLAALCAHKRRPVEERFAAGPEWTSEPLGADLVFRMPLGIALDPDNFRNLTCKVTDQAGLGRWSPHELRHSAASLLLAMNAPLKVVSETLGHSSIRINADDYRHLMELARAEAAEAMERVLWA